MLNLKSIPSINTGPLGALWARNSHEVMNRASNHLLAKGLVVGRQAIFVNDPKAAYQLLLELEEHHLQKSPGAVLAIRQLMELSADQTASSLLTAAGSEWRALRKATGGSLSRQSIEGYSDRITRVIGNVLSQLSPGHIDFSALSDNIAAEVILDLMLPPGATVSEDLQRLIAAIDVITEGVAAKIRKPWKFLDGAFKAKLKAARELVGEQTANLYELLIGSETADQTLLGTLLNSNLDMQGTVTFEQVVLNQILTFIIAGQETTGNAIQWLFALLAQNPEAYALVKDEVRNHDLSNMPEKGYLYGAIQETLRLRPSVMTMGRQTLHDVVLGSSMGDYQIPAGTVFLILPTNIHTRPSHWVDPQKFDIHRWPEAGKSIERETHYLAFGAGSRRCPGESLARQEMHIFAHQVLTRFDIQFLNHNTVQMLAGGLTTEMDHPLQAVLSVRQ